MEIIEMYADKLNSVLEQLKKANNRINAGAKVCKALETLSATPEISLMDFISKTIPNSYSDPESCLAEELSFDVLAMIFRYESDPSEKNKSEIINAIAQCNNKLLYRIKKLKLELNISESEIDNEIIACNNKINKLHKQMEDIISQIGILEAQKNNWIELRTKF